jgi:hypothetical protein
MARKEYMSLHVPAAIIYELQADGSSYSLVSIQVLPAAKGDERRTRRADASLRMRHIGDAQRLEWYRRRAVTRVRFGLSSEFEPLSFSLPSLTLTMAYCPSHRRMRVASVNAQVKKPKVRSPFASLLPLCYLANLLPFLFQPQAARPTALS